MTELSPKTSRIWWHIGLGAVAAWCLYLGFLGPKVSVGPPQLEGTDRAQPAEYRWTLRDLDDVPVDFGPALGQGRVPERLGDLVPAHASSELPSIARAWRPTPGSRRTGVAFVCVSTDESAATVREISSAGKAWPMTVLRATEPAPGLHHRGHPGDLPHRSRTAASPPLSDRRGAAWDDPSVIAFHRAAVQGARPGQTPSPGGGDEGTDDIETPPEAQLEPEGGQPPRLSSERLAEVGIDVRLLFRRDGVPPALFDRRLTGQGDVHHG